MNRTVVNFIVDAVAFAAFLLLAATGSLVRYTLPPGSGHFKTLWGMDRHEWGTIHFWIAAVLVAAMAFHLFLHWRWIVCTIRGRPGRGANLRIAVAVVVLAALIGLAASPFFGAAKSGEAVPPHRMQSDGASKEPTHEITGSMTLQEVEQMTGVSAAVIVKELGLPSDLPKDERLGRLRKKYGFEMESLRDVVAKQVEQKTARGSKP
jgi:hypothetical protein